MNKQTPKIGCGKPGPGRPKGAPNKTTALLKEALLVAATKAGGKGGLEAFLLAQARKENNQSFMSLLARLIPASLVTDGVDDIGPPVIILRELSSGGPEVPYIPRDYTRRD
jgi:hypothetical protein